MSDRVCLNIGSGPRTAFRHGQVYMAHRFGFTERSLGHRLSEVGFAEARGHMGSWFDLCAIASDTPPGAGLDVLEQMTGLSAQEFGY